MNKTSDVYTKLITNLQKSMISEDDRFINATAEIIGADVEKNKVLLQVIRMHDEFLKASIGKALTLTLEELGIIEKDVDLFDDEVSNKLLLEGVNKGVNGK